MVKLMGVGVVYLTSVVLGEWQEKFKGYDPLYLKSSGTLFREMSVLFITGSGVLDGIFSLVAGAADLPEASHKRVTDLGRLYLLVMILYTSESDKETKMTEIWETLFPFIKEAFPSVESLIAECIDKQLVDGALAGPIQSYLQVVRSAVENDDTQAFQRAVEDIMTLFGVSKEVLLGDLIRMSEISYEIAQALGVVSSEAEQTVTHVIQSA